MTGGFVQMGIDDSSPQTIRFGPLEANLLARELRKNGIKIKLQEQPFAVLAALLEQPGRVFSRDDPSRRCPSVATALLEQCSSAFT